MVIGTPRTLDTQELHHRLIRTVLFFLLACCVLSPFWWSKRVDAEPVAQSTQLAAKDDSPIHITSDTVTANQEMRWIEFSGNVKATQDDVIVKADRIKIYYKADAGTPEGANAIDRIVCQGEVVIVFDQKTKTATAEKAVYIADKEILELTGGEPAVRSGKNVIRGDKITLYQAENRSLVEGGNTGQVEATFYSEDKKGLMQ